MSTHISVPPQLLLERVLTLEIVRVTERAAVSAARLRGHGNEKAADQAAVDAMRRELNKLPIEGTVVIGEGERDEAPMLFIGEKVGINAGPRVDIAVDPLEGTTLCAKNMPGSIATMAMADGGTLLHAPDVYMQKIAVGPGYARGVVELDASPADNVRRLAKAKGVDTSAITVLVLDRPRHSDIINGVRSTGAAVRLITDGDVAGVIHCADPDNTGVDMYIGTGGAPEGVLAAVALRCIGGQMQCRLILDTEEKRERARKMGVTDPRMIYGIEDMAKGVDTSAITVLVLDRPRHSDIINGVRSTGAAVRLITDGDVAGVIHCADPDNTGVDMYIGTGGAPEGVLAAAALRCIGGQMQCRLILDSDEKRDRARKMGVTDPRMIYGIEDMAKGDCLFAATGVTDGSLLSGVKFRKDVIQTETVVMRSVTGTVRYIKAEHRQLEKFQLD